MRANALGTALLCAAALCSTACESESTAPPGKTSTTDDAPPFECAAWAERIRGTALSPLVVSPSGPRDGECYRAVEDTLEDGLWISTFAGPVTPDVDWEAVLWDRATVPNVLWIVLAGFAGDGVFAVVPPNDALRPAPGQAMVAFDLDRDPSQLVSSDEIAPDWVAVEGTIAVRGVREQAYGPPHMTATIRVTVRNWVNGAPQGPSVALSTTLESVE